MEMMLYLNEAVSSVAVCVILGATLVRAFILWP
jgi:hypothetical protein